MIRLLQYMEVKYCNYFPVDEESPSNILSSKQLNKNVIETEHAVQE